MITRQEAVEAVRKSVQNINLVRHMLATEAIMRSLARLWGEDEEEWGLAGLLHDIDVKATEGCPQEHSRLGASMARDLGAPEAVCRAILCHNEAHGVPPESRLEKALACADPLTGLIVAAALVRPDKKISGVTPESLRKRFSEKRFAAGADREQIACCPEVGLSLEEFLACGLEAMKGVAPELGL